MLQRLNNSQIIIHRRWQTIHIINTVVYIALLVFNNANGYTFIKCIFYSIKSHTSWWCYYALVNPGLRGQNQQIENSLYLSAPFFIVIGVAALAVSHWKLHRVSSFPLSPSLLHCTYPVPAITPRLFWWEYASKWPWFSLFNKLSFDVVDNKNQNINTFYIVPALRYNKWNWYP